MIVEMEIQKLRFKQMDLYRLLKQYQKHYENANDYEDKLYYEQSIIGYMKEIVKINRRLIKLNGNNNNNNNN